MGILVPQQVDSAVNQHNSRRVTPLVARLEGFAVRYPAFLLFGSAKPSSANIFRPIGPVTSCTNFVASSASSEPFIVAIHDVTVALADSGNSNQETLSPTFSASVLNRRPASTFPLSTSLRTSTPVVSRFCGLSRTPVRSCS